jgi:hypothetical protein
MGPLSHFTKSHQMSFAGSPFPFHQEPPNVINQLDLAYWHVGHHITPAQAHHTDMHTDMWDITSLPRKHITLTCILTCGTSHHVLTMCLRAQALRRAGNFKLQINQMNGSPFPFHQEPPNVICRVPFPISPRATKCHFTKSWKPSSQLDRDPG